MPGSKSVGDDLAGIGIPSSTGDPLRTAARIPRQRIHQQRAIPVNPQVQIIKRTAGYRVRAAGAWDGNKAAEMAGGARVWPTSSMTMEKLDCSLGEGVHHASWAPNAVRTERGIRNLHDTASHSQCRNLARFLRSVRVSSPATPAKRVDCHRCSATGRK